MGGWGVWGVGVFGCLLVEGEVVGEGQKVWKGFGERRSVERR